MPRSRGRKQGRCGCPAGRARGEAGISALVPGAGSRWGRSPPLPPPLLLLLGWGLLSASAAAGKSGRAGEPAAAARPTRTPSPPIPDRVPVSSSALPLNLPPSQTPTLLLSLASVAPHSPPTLKRPHSHPHPHCYPQPQPQLGRIRPMWGPERQTSSPVVAGRPDRGFSFFSLPAPKVPGFSPINFPGALPASRSRLAHPFWGLERNGAPPPHFRVCGVCPSLPPPIFSRLKPAPPPEPTAAAAPSPSVPLPRRSGLGGGQVGGGPELAAPEDSGGGWRVLSDGRAGAGVVPGGGGGSVAARLRAATFPSVAAPRQSALSRALLQPSAGAAAAAAAARVAGPAPGDRIGEGNRPGGCGESRNFGGVWLRLVGREGTRIFERTQPPLGTTGL